MDETSDDKRQAARQRLFELWRGPLQTAEPPSEPPLIEISARLQQMARELYPRG